MCTEESKKIFSAPECEICRFDLQDIITSSIGDDWGMGEFQSIDAPEAP